MWAPVLPLLVVSYAQAAQESGRFPDSVGATFVPLPSGQATYFPGDGQILSATATTAAIAATTAAQGSRAHTAWSLPWLARKRKRRRAKAESTSGRATVPAAGTASTMAPTATCSGALASIVGAFILSGATLGVWPQVAMASPFDPRPPPKSSRQPFFEGWFIRLVDHEQRLSFAVIFGSFRSRGGKEFDQHYVSLSYLHEPKGGLLPEDVEDAEEDALDSSADDSEREWEGGSVGEHSMARPFQIAKRFSSWVREQRSAILRGFGMEGGSGTSEPSGELGKGEGGGVGAPGVGGQWEEAEGETPPAESGAGLADADGTGEKARRLRGQSEEEEEEEEEEDKPALRGERDASAGGYAEGESEQGTGEDGGKGEVNGGDVVASPGTGEPLGSRVVESNDVGEHLHGTIGTEQEKHISGSVGDGEAEDHTYSDIDASEAEGKGATSDISAAPDDGQPSVMPRTAPQLPINPPRTSLPPPQEESIERTWTFHAFPAPETVTISSRGEPIDTVPNLTDDPNFTWEADGIGSFMVDGDSGRLSFQLPELSVAASFRHRLPWSKEQPNSAGPEGWLQRTGLLPLHYFVHTMGSEAGYSLKATAAPRAVVGRGSMHMEANYGESFPTGWVWAQGCSETEGLCGNVFRDGEMTGEGTGSSGSSRCRQEGAAGNDASEDGVASSGDVGEPTRFVLTGGRFVIGPLTTNSFVLAFRSKKHDWNFRTTDLDRIAVTASRKGNSLTLVARSWCDTRVLEADIHAPEGSFGPAIYVPTAEGFSNAPGCVESYAATATFRLYTKGDAEEGGGGTRPLVLREEVEIKLAALEFGGEYQDT